MTLSAEQYAVFDSCFQFRVGDFVRLKLVKGRMLIISRWLGELPSGVTPQYHVRMFGASPGSITAGVIAIEEIELRACPETG